MDKLKAFVTMRDRFTWAIPMLEYLADSGLEVILIDNNSTYPKLLEWYDKQKLYKVHRRKDNQIAWAFFKTELFTLYPDRYFFISDSDYDYSKVPKDFIDVLFKGLEVNDWKANKSGMSCEYLDLPDNAYTEIIKGHEAQFWANKVGDYYRAWIDTGPAIYDRTVKNDNWFEAVRAERPYIVKHMDWYLTPENVREEDLYYIEHGEYFGYAPLWKQMIYDKL